MSHESGLRLERVWVCARESVARWWPVSPTIAVESVEVVTRHERIHSKDADRIIQLCNSFIENDLSDSMRVVWVPAWLMDEKDLRVDEASTPLVVGQIKRITEKAIQLEDLRGNEDWPPKSQIIRFAGGGPVERPNATLGRFAGVTRRMTEPIVVVDLFCGAGGSFLAGVRYGVGTVGASGHAGNIDNVDNLGRAYLESVSGGDDPIAVDDDLDLQDS